MIIDYDLAAPVDPIVSQRDKRARAHKLSTPNKYHLGQFQGSPRCVGTSGCSTFASKRFRNRDLAPALPPQESASRLPQLLPGAQITPLPHQQSRCR